MTTKAQQIELDNALVAPENRHVIGKCNMRINPGMKPKEPTYQVALDALALTTCYPAFLITAEVPVIYMHQFWATVTKHKSSYRFKIDTKKFSVNVKVFSDYSQTYVQGFRNVHATTAVDDSLLGTLENRLQTCRDTQVYGAIHYRSKKIQKKSDSAISSEESPSKKKSAKAKDVTATKPKPTKKKAPIKADRGKGDSREEDDDDEIDFEDESDNDDDDHCNDDNDNDDDANDDDNQEGDDTNNDDEETDNDRTKSDIIKIPELYNDVNVNLGNKDADMTDDDQGGADQQNVSQELGFKQLEEDAHVTLTLVLDTQKADEPVQSYSVSSDFTRKLLNLENPSPADNEIASLMDTTTHHTTVVPEITFVFTITIPPPHPFFNPLTQQATPTPTPTTSEATTSFPSLLDFSSIFKFNDRVTNLEKDLLEIKQVDQYAQALSFIPAIVDRYIDNKLGEAIQKAIVAHNLDYFATPMIEKNVIKSLEAAVLAKSSSQPKSTYEAETSLSEFELTKILIDKMEKNKSYDKADYKRELYDALVKSYQTNKDLFDTYGEVFTLKRSQDNRDKDQDPFAGSDQWTKRRKSSKEAESSKDSRSKEKMSSSTSKDSSHYQQKPSGKFAHA
ncbi:hypothetical protein Tco_0651200 [Tanacetum coccineum]